MLEYAGHALHNPVPAFLALELNLATRKNHNKEAPTQHQNYLFDWSMYDNQVLPPLFIGKTANEKRHVTQYKPR